MKIALEKLEKLSDNVRIIDQPRHYNYSEVKKLIEIAYLEGKDEMQTEALDRYTDLCPEHYEEEINNLLKSF